MSAYPTHIEVAPALPVSKTYTYGVPPEWPAPLIGQRVLVPMRRRRVTGYVIDVVTAPNNINVKPVLALLDEAPLFPAPLLRFFNWIARYYHQPLGEVIKTALPGGLNQMDVSRLYLTPEGNQALSRANISVQQKALLTKVSQRSWQLASLRKSLPHVDVEQLVRSAEKAGWLERRREMQKARFRPKQVRSLRPGDGSADVTSLTKARREVLDLVISHGVLAASELERLRPGGLRLANYLVASGHLEMFQQQVYRDPLGEAITVDKAPQLTAEQQRAVSQIETAAGNGFHPFLLAGITGSGKTEVYLRITAKTLQEGRNVIVLVPEIALISQTERRFRARFGKKVAVLHSGLTGGERLDQWLQILRGEVSVAVGARSAIFAPFAHVGLIIVDEEHDGSYKQEEGVRYNARDLAVVRARQDDCAVVLGSATPSIQSYHNALKGKYRQLVLTQRIARRALPHIKVVDLNRQRNFKGPRRFITPQLLASLRTTLEKKEQALLFLNRRGFAGYPACHDCGQAFRCNHCDITLTYHKAAGVLKCHYCGYHLPAATSCRHCGSPRLYLMGLGTERLAETIQSLFPDARLARMDRDTTSRKGALLKMLKDLRHNRIDILIGTQMVAKGHDFPNITLVGIICADLSLDFPDFRAGEQTFQLLAQVAGRAGRGKRPGQVILQTYTPDHFSITAARDQDFRAFYRKEIEDRRLLHYPPFTRLAQLGFAGRDSRVTAERAHTVGRHCRQIQNNLRSLRNTVQVWGPVESPLTRIAGQYRWQILIKGKIPARLHQLIDVLQQEHAPLFSRRDVKININIDPHYML
jgi:primosomal protein N' (replication factor Y)